MRKIILWLEKVLTKLMVSHVSSIDLGKLLKRNSPDYLNNQVVFPSFNFGLVSECCYFCNKCKEDPLSL